MNGHAQVANRGGFRRSAPFPPEAIEVSDDEALTRCVAMKNSRSRTSQDRISAICAAVRGKRIPLGSDSTDPEFWRRLHAASTLDAARDGTPSKLIAEYRASNAFTELRPASNVPRFRA
jgi:hypothetical protein